MTSGLYTITKMPRFAAVCQEAIASFCGQPANDDDEPPSAPIGDDARPSEATKLIEKTEASPVFCWRKEMLRDRSLSLAAKGLGALVADHMTIDRKTAWPKQSTLADICGVSRSTVHRHMRELVDAGWLTLSRQRKANGHMSINEHRLAYPKHHVADSLHGARNGAEWASSHVAYLRHDHVADLTPQEVEELERKKASKQAGAKLVVTAKPDQPPAEAARRPRSKPRRKSAPIEQGHLGLGMPNRPKPVPPPGDAPKMFFDPEPTAPPATPRPPTKEELEFEACRLIYAEIFSDQPTVANWIKASSRSPQPNRRRALPEVLDWITDALRTPDRLAAWREVLGRLKAEGWLARNGKGIDQILSSKGGVIGRALEMPTEAAKPDPRNLSPEDREHQRWAAELARRQAAKQNSGESQ